MGLSLKFVTGPANEILSAMEAGDYQSLDHLTALQAAFSLHLQPRDLQVLFDCAGRYAAEPLPPLRSSLTCYLDEADRGFFLAGPDWADSIASIAPESYGKLAGDWFAGMAEQYPGENIGPPSPAAIQAVRDLLALCRDAKRLNMAVMHIGTS